MDSEMFLPAHTPQSRITWRLYVFAALTVGLAIAVRHSLVDLVSLSMRDETYSYMPLIPLVSGYLLFTGRRRLLAEVQSAFLLGALVAAAGVVLSLLKIDYSSAALYRDQLSFVTLGALFIWVGGLIALFGMRSFRSGCFPILFLLFMVPIPSFLLSEMVQFLQQASTEVATFLFQFMGVPFLRDGFKFELPGLSVVVAEQCCGIRSSLSLFITGVLAAYFGLNSPWRRGLLILSIVPITIFKNALRIFTLSLLGAYVDQRILGSVVHRMGGIPFFVLALMIFGFVLWFLRRGEGAAAAHRGAN